MKGLQSTAFLSVFSFLQFRVSEGFTTQRRNIEQQWIKDRSCGVARSSSTPAGMSPFKSADVNVESATINNDEKNIASLCRRKIIERTVSLIAFTISKPVLAQAVDSDSDDNKAATADSKGADDARSSRALVKGTVTIKAPVRFPEDVSTSALYITARPNKADNVPKAILDGSNGKPPPVLAARFSNPTFPFDFELSELDLTVEGVAQVKSAASQSVSDTYWWENQDLIISGRWDTDGIAATRDPTDLVGRSQFYASRGEKVELQIGGRGVTGKLVTGKSSSK